MPKKRPIFNFEDRKRIAKQICKNIVRFDRDYWFLENREWQKFDTPQDMASYWYKQWEVLQKPYVEEHNYSPATAQAIQSSMYWQNLYVNKQSITEWSKTKRVCFLNGYLELNKRSKQWTYNNNKENWFTPTQIRLELPKQIIENANKPQDKQIPLIEIFEDYVSNCDKKVKQDPINEKFIALKKYFKWTNHLFANEGNINVIECFYEIFGFILNNEASNIPIIFVGETNLGKGEFVSLFSKSLNNDKIIKYKPKPTELFPITEKQEGQFKFSDAGLSSFWHITEVGMAGKINKRAVETFNQVFDETEPNITIEEKFKQRRQVPKIFSLIASGNEFDVGVVPKRTFQAFTLRTLYIESNSKGSILGRQEIDEIRASKQVHWYILFKSLIGYHRVKNKVVAIRKKAFSPDNHKLLLNKITDDFKLLDRITQIVQKDSEWTSNYKYEYYEKWHASLRDGYSKLLKNESRDFDFQKHLNEGLDETKAIFPYVLQLLLNKEGAIENFLLAGYTISLPNSVLDKFIERTYPLRKCQEELENWAHINNLRFKHVRKRFLGLNRINVARGIEINPHTN